MNILQTIVDRKKEEVAIRKKNVSEAKLSDGIYFDRTPLSLSRHIIDGIHSGIISEFKRKSPSKKAINLDVNVADVTKGYEKAGSSAISVLTDIDFFGGSDEDLLQARKSVQIPILRKDFIIDPYQIIEAKSLGADVILLIAEILTKAEVLLLSRVANDCGLEVLFEIHTEDQISKFNENIHTIGVNNRNLKTFVTDIMYSIDIYPKLPSSAVKISESGLDNINSLIMLKQTGYQGFLIGENFMKTDDPGQTCKIFTDEFIQSS